MELKQKKLDKDLKMMERDVQMSKFMYALSNSKLEEGPKNKLMYEYQHMMDLILKVDNSVGFGDFQKNSILQKSFQGLQHIFGERKIKAVIFAFIAGMILSLIPTCIYIAMITNTGLQFEFTPNVMASQRPLKFQIIKTQEDLDKAKTANMSNKKNLKIGIAVSYDSSEGLYVESSQENALYEEIPKEVTNIKSGNFVFSPNVLKSRKPTEMELIENETQLQLARKIKNLESTKSLEIGSLLAKSDRGFYFAIPKSMVGTDYTIKRFSDSINKTTK